MPLGEFIAELVLRALLEIVLYGFFYGVGFVFLKAVTFGKLRLAPLASIGERNRRRKGDRRIDWSIWLRRAGKGRALKAEWTCVVGALVLVAVGVLIYLVARSK